MAVRLRGPEGEGAGAVWALELRKKKRQGVRVRRRRERGLEAIGEDGVELEVVEWGVLGIYGIRWRVNPLLE